MLLVSYTTRLTLIGLYYVTGVTLEYKMSFELSSLRKTQSTGG